MASMRHLAEWPAAGTECVLSRFTGGTAIPHLSAFLPPNKDFLYAGDCQLEGHFY
jgi:hypothetical protein